MMPEDNICQFLNAVFVEWNDKISVYPPYITCVNQIDVNFVIRRYINNRESIENVQSGVNGYATQLLNDNNDMLPAARTCLINRSAGVHGVDDHLHITYNDTDDAFVVHSTVAHHAEDTRRGMVCACTRATSCPRIMTSTNVAHRAASHRTTLLRSAVCAI